MPRGDGTGPDGRGSMTGRGLGNCISEEKSITTNNYRRGWCRDFRRGLRRGSGRGYGRGYGYSFDPLKTKEFLANEREFLKEQLKEIENSLQDIDEKNKA